MPENLREIGMKFIQIGEQLIAFIGRYKTQLNNHNFFFIRFH